MDEMLHFACDKNKISYEAQKFLSYLDYFFLIQDPDGGFSLNSRLLWHEGEGIS